MNFKRCFSLYMVFLLLFSSVSALALPSQILQEVESISDEIDFNSGFNPQDEVTLIVEVEGDPVLASKEAAVFGTEFIDTPKGNEHEEAILSLQSEIAETINEDVTKDAEIISSYTLLFNGFSIKTTYENLKKIKNIPGVKNAYVDEGSDLRLALYDSVEMAGASPAELSSYSGKGQVVAILDSGFEINHKFLSADVADPKYSKESILNLVKNEKLNAKLDLNKFYHSSKIPFKYDYAENVNDVDSDGISHGTHVAGIVGGKGITYNGETVNGVAPDAQLLLMKVIERNGQIYKTPTMNALEDAVRLGADVINYSIAGMYTSVCSQGEADFQKMFAAARNAGVFISVAAGNEARGFYEKTPLAENIDYGAIGTPGSFSEPTTVASVNKPAGNSNLKMSDFSSYGVNDNLELKPEITAPGGSIFSSAANKTNSYTIMNGTSMAAPHISGAAAIMYEYFDDIGCLTDAGKDRVLMAENMLMSTALVIKNTSGVPYSPRLQGAGLVNVSAALKTPAILIGNGEKCKISLGDNLGEEINIKFTVQNLTDMPVTYDKISVCALTDGYTTTNGKNYVSDSVELEVKSNSLPESITLEGGSSVEISAKAVLPEGELKKNKQVFKNGFFIDGFISLEKTGDEALPKISIPFTGFYGDWEQAAVFDLTMYDAGGSTLLYNGTDYPHTYGTVLYTTFMSGDRVAMRYLGKTYGGLYNKEYIALSPKDKNNDGYISMVLTPMRNIKSLSALLYDKNGTLKKQSLYSNIINKFHSEYLTVMGISDLSDGDYTLSFVAEHTTAEDSSQMIELPFYIDRTAPEIIKAVSSDGVLELTVKDNKHISYVQAFYIDGNAVLSDTKPFNNPKEGEASTVSFDLAKINAQGADLKDIYILAYDMADNMYANSVSCLTGDIHPDISGFIHTQNVYDIDFIYTSYKETAKYELLLAFYDKDGCLIYITSDEKEISKGKGSFEFFGTADISGAVECRLFIWDKEKEMYPVDTAKAFDIREMMQ